jgi:hypothetical protein
MNESLNNNLILWPVLVQIWLTLMIFVLLARRKAKAIKQGEVDRKKTALHSDAWPDFVLQVSNNIQNQFQTPVLFYVMCFAFILSEGVTWLVLVFAWLYVASRLGHAYIHINSNYVPLRLRLFLLSTACLIIMAILLTAKLAMLT